MEKITAVDITTLAYIQTVVQTAKLVGIESIIIEPGRVRAVDDNKSVIILQTDGVPPMSFGAIGLNRTDVFSSRLEIAKSAGKFEVEATTESVENKETKQSETFARALRFKGKGVKIDYRCANPTLMKIPKALNDSMVFTFNMTPEAVLMLTKGHSAMACDEVMFTGTIKDGVSLEMRDINGDVMSYVISDTVNGEDKQSTAFKHNYPVKILLSLFKVVPSSEINISTRGIMRITINDLNLYIMPRV